MRVEGETGEEDVGACSGVLRSEEAAEVEFEEDKGDDSEDDAGGFVVSNTFAAVPLSSFDPAGSPNASHMINMLPLS